MGKKYDFQKIEKKWWAAWQKAGIYRAVDPPSGGSKKPFDAAQGKRKFYGLVEFPYPSGEGLHTGHIRSYTAMDIIARKRRMEGYNVLYPMGWDAFGLPTENYAVKTGIHPKIVTKKNTDTFRRQLQSLGFSFDWSREINTTDPNYYKWTQWIFLQMFKRGLAYKKKMPINWCLSCKIGLANEEVVNGRCERCGGPVETREKDQWLLAITKYADRLLADLNKVDYWERIKTQQRNWIGKSEGAEIEFRIKSEFNYVFLHGYKGSPKSNFWPWLIHEVKKTGAKVYAPQLPNPAEPNIEKQVNFILRNYSFNKNTIIVGQSLGCTVAMKLLPRLKTKIAGLVLAAPPLRVEFLDGDKRPLLERATDWKFNFDGIRGKTGWITVLRDRKDHIVPARHPEIIAKSLRARLVDVIAKKTHFDGECEPAILRELPVSVEVFTTRPDTLFGATFIALAPEHHLVSIVKSQVSNWKEVEVYIKKAKAKSEEERIAEGFEKTGVELKGVKAVNPVNGEELPVWVADFVLVQFGTGALFGDAHDERDVAFAKKYRIPLKPTLKPLDGRDDRKIRNLEECFTGEGILYDSGQFSGLTSAEAKKAITAWLAEKGQAKATVTYRLRDWIFSRQRYWGEPIPLVFCEACYKKQAGISKSEFLISKQIQNPKSKIQNSQFSAGELFNPGWVPVPEKNLPVKLPEVKNFKPTDTGESPLASATAWVKTKCPRCKGSARRETDTMPNWAGSSWYFLAYAMHSKLFPKSKVKGQWSKVSLEAWLPVDWYNGGMEHTTLHLLYSRFWNKFLYDIGAVPTSEPYRKRTSHGIILGEGGVKMSKSKPETIINPDFLVREFGADAVRIYEMFMGPFEQTIVWDHRGLIGVSRFLNRVWEMGTSEKIQGKTNGGSERLERALHRAIKKVGEDIEALGFNTAVSSLMVLVNTFAEAEEIPQSVWRKFLVIFAPFAPFISEELWSRFFSGKKSRILDSQSESGQPPQNYKSIHQESWPTYDPKLIKENTFALVIQVNGKVRDTVELRRGVSKTDAEKAARNRDKIKQMIADQKIKKVIFVPNRLINIVT